MTHLPPAAFGISQPQGQDPAGLKHQSVAAVSGRPFGKNPLFTFVRSGGIEPGLQAEAGVQAERRGVGHDDVRASVEHLFTARVLTADRRLNTLLFEARTAWIGITVDQAHHIGLIARPPATDMKMNRFTWSDAELISIADDLHVCLPPDSAPPAA